MKPDLLDDQIVSLTPRGVQPGDVFRRDRQPPPLTCGACEAVQDWAWYEPPARHQANGHRGRWCPPSVDPCADCKRSELFQAGAELDRRMKAAGVPRTLRKYRFDRLEAQGADEADADFVARIKGLARQGRHTVGVGVHAIEAVYELTEWRPGHGSLALWGPVGTGKTLLLCALVRQLCTPRDRTVEELRAEHPWLAGRSAAAIEYAVARGLNKVVRGGGGAGAVVYVTEAELAEREALSWKGDPAPLYRITTANVVVLDELWQQEKPTKAEKQAVQKLVDYRYREGLPTLFATNADWSEVVDERSSPYGPRTADRLYEMTLGRVVRLGGLSWRRS